MSIKRLEFNGIGPFDDIGFDFDDHVNVFVGPNNSGKSASLMVLGDISVYPFGLPTKLISGESPQFQLVVQVGREHGSFVGALPTKVNTEAEDDDPTGRESGQRSLFSHEAEVQLGVSLEILKAVGYSSFIPALRRSTDFRAEGPVVRERDTWSERRGNLEVTYSSATQRRRAGLSGARMEAMLARSQHPEIKKRKALLATNPSVVSDEAVIQKIIELDYTAYRRNRPAIRGILDKIAAVASEITEGFPIKFLGIEEDDEGLYPQFRTPDGDVALDVLSQGTQSIIQWLAHLLIGYSQYYDYPANLEPRPGVLIIDEIDAHLHPSWQRRILPTLTRHFPNLQVFCSTHSPLMLAGLKAGQVQLLRRDGERKVTVTRNEADIVGWSADEILRNFLDVPNPTDLVTAGHIERLQELRRLDEPSDKELVELEELRRTVNEDLLAGPIARQMGDLGGLLSGTKADVSKQRAGQVAEKPGAKRRRKSSKAESSKTSAS